MKVTISVIGRFWAFNLADQLHKRGYLRRLITTYPKFEAVKYGIPRSHIASHLPVELLSRAWHRTPSWVKKHHNAQLSIHNATDLCASFRIPEDSNVFVGWSSVSLWSLRKAKRYGAVTVLERGSSHMRYQTRLLLEEHERFGWKLPFTHPGVHDKELQEYEETDYIAVPSLFVKRTFLEEGVPEAKLLHNPFGVDLASFNPIPKEDKTFRIIHCGNITFQKGVHYLLQAFSELKLPDAELWLIGYLSDELRPLLKKWDNGKILHKGPYPQRELYKYYSQGSVFCLASIQEGLAQVIPQAMACGLPIICTTNTGGEDMVRNGQDGFIVPIRDVDALKEKLVLLYEDSQLCKSMGESARERVSGRYSWDHYGENAVRHYREILALKAGRQTRQLS